MLSIQFQIMSDLHLETPQTRPTYDEFKIQPQCLYLALLGDIGNVQDPRLFTFIEEQLHHFALVFFLLGNHEPYGMTFLAAQESVRAFKDYTDRQRSVPNSSTGEFVFLDQTRRDLPGEITVLGCTLFSHIMPEQRETVSRFVSDFSSIDGWTMDTHCAAHEADLAWLNGQVTQIVQDEPHRSIVIFTHHSPTTLEAANNPGHLKDSAQVRSAFTTDVSDQVCWASTQVRLWAFGHTHFNCDIQDPQTGKRIVANQKGYRRAELLTFSATKIVGFEVDVQAHEGHVQRKQRAEHCLVL